MPWILSMRLTTNCIFLAQLIPCCWGGFWSRDSDKLTSSSRQTYALSTDAVLTPEELDAIFLSQDSLRDYARRPDCFRRAASLIRSHCAQLDMNENERVNAAISMTLCELATAKHHSVPLECVPFSVESNISEHSPISRMQGECVDALSRSAQFWSSYSGYLREVPQLCFAFRRWHDIDTAREIYRNVTLQQGTLLRYLIARERATERSMESWESRLSELQDVVSQMNHATRKMDSGIADLASEFDYTLRMFRDAMTDVRREQENRELQLLHENSHALEDLRQRHGEELRGLVPILATSLLQQVNATLGEVQAQTRTSLDVANRVQDQWISFGAEINNLAQYIILLSATASEVAHTFDGSIRQGHVLNQTQYQATLSATHLIAALANLTTATHAELEKINNVSAAMIQRTLVQVETGRPSWLFLRFMRALGTALCVDLDFVDYLSQLASSRLLSAVLALVGFLLRLSFSGLVTIGIFVLSMKRSLTMRLPISDSSATSSALTLRFVVNVKVFPVSLVSLNDSADPFNDLFVPFR
ncbi:putative tht1-like nuclear fusion protein [Lyophyllum shimeji]|uniref:Tht1-like nuclear fusion protein n=1 Tax=Lyophyllum shimeji TaxID=47721 RepID=A0A9P3PMV0_LYOSH|nr:putative tht1-like nuclear fusion protein [Lyophyllum shimeji]